jgi:hypothetical protein
MNGLTRCAFLGACAAVTIGCGSDTEPSKPDAGNSKFPMLVNEGGHILSPLRLVVVVAANDSLRESLFAFGKALPSSQWWPQVATPFGVSPTATAFTVIAPPIAAGTQMTFADVTAYVQAAAVDSAGYAADGRTTFLIFLPAGVSVSCTDGACPTASAFHRPFGSSTRGQFDAIAVVVRGQGSTMEAMTLAASHEIIESATDPEENAWKLESAFHPWTASPWGMDDGGSFEENADMCEGTRILDGGFYYQRIFSNQAAALGGDPCVPAIPAPYFNVTTSGWYSTTAGEVSIPITGWSVGTVAEWVFFVDLGPKTPSLPSPTVSFSCPDTLLLNGGRYCGLNSGKTATMHVVLPAGAASQTFYSFRVLSFPMDAIGQNDGAAGEDYYHRWIFGVYVP